jgi:hypothetical protein
MAILSKQIGWSQEANLIYQIIKQTERLNQILPGNQSAFRVGVSKQIGWSNEANLYYEWLKSLSKLTAHYANCCTSTTTTTTTLFPPVPTDSIRIFIDNQDGSYGGVGSFAFSFDQTINVTISGSLPDYVTPLVLTSVTNYGPVSPTIGVGLYYVDIQFSNINLTNFRLEFGDSVAYDFNLAILANMTVQSLRFPGNKLPSTKVNELL